ncbi:MAG: ATP-grasp domain-containing protein [Gemmatimonadota bacterium]
MPPTRAGAEAATRAATFSFVNAHPPADPEGVRDHTLERLKVMIGGLGHGRKEEYGVEGAAGADAARSSTGDPAGDRTIAVATHREHPRATGDDRLALSRMAARYGWMVDEVPWDDPTVSWDRYRGVIIRSTWDYHRVPEAFLAWTERVEAAGTPLWNPASVIRWNADKRYLSRLERAGVPIVPTEWVAPGRDVELRRILERRGWTRAVVKPSVGATSYRTERVRATDHEAHARVLATILRDGDAMVQPFLAQICREGEWSFVFFADGEGALTFSHAVMKRPKAGDFRVQHQFGGSVRTAVPPPRLLGQLREIAAVVSATAPGPLLYARLDGVVGDGRYGGEGTFLLMEAELIEPMLFFGYARDSTARFASAVAACMECDRRGDRASAPSPDPETNATNGNGPT